MAEPNMGTGNGFNELYLTQADGSLVKVPEAAGLQKYPTMRTRFVKVLTSADGSKLVFIATLGVPREDGKPNQHRMFCLITVLDDFYFEEVDGPWIQHTVSGCLHVADVNGDGLDDIIVCNTRQDASMVFIMQSDSNWTQLDLGTSSHQHLRNWLSVRVADVTYDGVPDLLVSKASSLASIATKSTIKIRTWKAFEQEQTKLELY